MIQFQPLIRFFCLKFNLGYNLEIVETAFFSFFVREGLRVCVKFMS